MVISRSPLASFDRGNVPGYDGAENSRGYNTIDLLVRPRPRCGLGHTNRGWTRTPGCFNRSCRILCFLIRAVISLCRYCTAACQTGSCSCPVNVVSAAACRLEPLEVFLGACKLCWLEPSSAEEGRPMSRQRHALDIPPFPSSLHWR